MLNHFLAASAALSAASSEPSAAASAFLAASFTSPSAFSAFFLILPSALVVASSTAFLT